MKSSNIFGALAIAGLVVSGSAMAEGKKKADKKHDAKAAPAAPHDHCVSNECKGSVAGAKNECKGKDACKGLTKEKCEADGKGTWELAPAK